MRSYDLMNILGRAFAYGIFDNLNKYLSESCEYTSEYSNKYIKTSNEIIKWIKKVNYKIESYNRYTFKLMPIKDILKKGKIVKNQQNITNNDEYAILLYQHSDEYPAAACFYRNRFKNRQNNKDFTFS